MFGFLFCGLGGLSWASVADTADKRGGQSCNLVQCVSGLSPDEQFPSPPSLFRPISFP